MYSKFEPVMSGGRPATLPPVARPEPLADSARVLRNTYWLLALSLLPTVAGALVGTQLNFIGLFRTAPIMTPLLMLAVMMGSLWVVTLLRNSAWGVAALFGFTFISGLMLTPILSVAAGFRNGGQLVALAGGLTASAFSTVVGWPCFRLRGHYFAMATIAVVEIVQAVVNGWEALGGAVGLSLPLSDEKGFAGFVFNRSKLPYHYIALALLAVTLLANWLVARSRTGYYLRAIKDEPDAARSLGVSLTRYKLYAIALSSFFAATGGTLYAQKELFIDPGSTLSTALSIKIALVAILGGVGTLFGPVLGAAVLTAIEETTRILLGGSGRGTDVVVYGALVVLIAVYKPAGLMGWIGEWWRGRQASRTELAP
jgi:branched-chain amino acid transport system permease protein